MVPVVGVGHTPTTEFATEAYSLSPGSPISVPVPKQLQVSSARGRGLETPTTVSDHVLTTVVANNWLFSICLRQPIVHPYCPMP